MSDDTEIPGEEEEEAVPNAPRMLDNSPTMSEFSGVNSCMLLRYPGAEHASIDFIKNCVGVSIYSKPGSQLPDDIKFLVMVKDGFELRDITECYNINSEKEYEPTFRPKVVH